MTINKILKPKYNYDLIRLGKDFDGGYLVGENSVKEANYLISFGINEDWSFEKDFKSRNKDVKIYCYDDRISKKFLIKKFLDTLIYLPYKLNIKKLLKRFVNFFDYLSFSKKANFNTKVVSYGDLSEIIKDKKNIFLKIDIEGYEFRLLDEILENQEKIIGLAIEFHNCDLLSSKVYDFVEKFKLNLIHIHPNNSAPVDKDGLPWVLELSFEKNKKVIDGINSLPHPLDQKTSSNYEDIRLNFND